MTAAAFIHLEGSDDNYSVDIRIDAITAIVDKGERGSVIQVGALNYPTTERFHHLAERIERLSR